MGMTFPNELAEHPRWTYTLLASELALRRQMEAVAIELVGFPLEVRFPKTICSSAWEGTARQRKCACRSSLGGDTLMVYHYMFPRHAQDERPGPSTGPLAAVPLTDSPCPSCTVLIDMWEVRCLTSRAWGGNVVIVARAPTERVAAFARP